MDANRPVSQRVVKYLVFSSLLLSVFFQSGCTTKSIYVPVPGERPEWNPGLVKTVNPLTTYSEGNERQPSVSPDGKYVAYVSRPLGKKVPGQFNNDVYVMDAETGRNPRTITNTEGEQEVYYPYWMGKDRLLYTRYDDVPDFPRSLYWHDFPPKQLEGYSILRREDAFWTGNTFLQSGFPSPDGKRIAVCLETPKGRKSRVVKPDIFRRQPRLENPQILLFDVVAKQAKYFASGFEPAWSPDGMNIAYTQKRGDNFFIFVKNIATNDERQVTLGTDAVDWSPCWSPSGSAIAFTSHRGEDWNIWKVDVDGMGLAQLTNSKGTEWDPSWGAGGNIYFSFLRRGQDWDIYRLQLNPPSGLK